MNILMLTSEFPPFRGGVSTYAKELALGAVEQGHEVTLVAPDYGADQSQADAALPFKVVRFAGGPNRAKDILAKMLWTRWFAKGRDFDIVHAIDWPFFIPLALSRYRRKSRCVLTFHGTEINMMARPSRSRLLGLMRFWDGWAEHVANSRFTADHLARTFPKVKREEVRAIPLGVRAPVGYVPVGRKEARKRLDVEQDAVLLLSLGRVVERKGVHVTLAALALLPEAVQRRLIFYVVGPALQKDYQEKLQEQAGSLAVDVRFTGGVSAEMLETLYEAADIFCLPAVMGRDGAFEGFGLVFVEAGLRGVPQIGSALGGIPDAVLDGETGLLVPSEDARVLADAILRLVEDEDLRQRLGEGARNYAQRLDWASIAQATYAE